LTVRPLSRSISSGKGGKNSKNSSPEKDSNKLSTVPCGPMNTIQHLLIGRSQEKPMVLTTNNHNGVIFLSIIIVSYSMVFGVIKSILVQFKVPPSTLSSLIIPVWIIQCPVITVEQLSLLFKASNSNLIRTGSLIMICYLNLSCLIWAMRCR
jgi:hypothetical protein